MIGRWAKPSAPEAQGPMGFDDFDVRLGDLMRGERATMGKSLLDVQRDLKIKASYIAAIENAVGKKAILEMLPLQPGDVPDTSADVTALVAAIGYKPSTPIQVGVNAFVDWYRQYHGL